MERLLLERTVKALVDDFNEMTMLYDGHPGTHSDLIEDSRRS